MVVVPRPLGTLKFLLAWLTPWRPTFSVRAGPFNLKFYAHHRDAIARHVAKYGTHEPLLTRWLSDYLAAARPGLFIDVGANFGWHSLHAAQQPAVEAVLAFEPEPFNAWLLDRNLSANRIDKVIVHPCAVGAKRGVAKLYRYKSSNFGRHSAAMDYGYGFRNVPVVDLDSALAEMQLANRPVCACKIDVEGYEPAVIEGASQTLKRTDVVIVEFSPELSRAGGLSTDEMIGRLHGAGFLPYALRAGGGTVRIGLDEFRGFEGSLDLIWARPNVAKAMNERPREKIGLMEIADQNKRVLKAL